MPPIATLLTNPQTVQVTMSLFNLVTFGVEALNKLASRQAEADARGVPLTYDDISDVVEQSRSLQDQVLQELAAAAKR